MKRDRSNETITLLSSNETSFVLNRDLAQSKSELIRFFLDDNEDAEDMKINLDSDILAILIKFMESGCLPSYMQVKQWVDMILGMDYLLMKISVGPMNFSDFENYREKEMSDLMYPEPYQEFIDFENLIPQGPGEKNELLRIPQRLWNVIFPQVEDPFFLILMHRRIFKYASSFFPNVGIMLNILRQDDKVFKKTPAKELFILSDKDLTNFTPWTFGNCLNYAVQKHGSLRQLILLREYRENRRMAAKEKIKAKRTAWADFLLNWTEYTDEILDLERFDFLSQEPSKDLQDFVLLEGFLEEKVKYRNFDFVSKLVSDKKFVELVNKIMNK